MPTIKVKKEMNLPQLIEWAWENSITNLSFRGHDEEGDLVVASFNDKREFTSGWCISKDDIFEIEVEEEITEDAKLYLVERYISSYEDFKLKYESHQNKSINSVLENNMPHIKTTHFYTEVNNELVLIWKNGKLVE